MDKRLSLLPAGILVLGLAQPAGELPAPPNEPAQVSVAGEAITIRYRGETIFEGTLKNREALGRATVNAYRAGRFHIQRGGVRWGAID